MFDFVKYCIFNNEVGSKFWCEDMDEKFKGDWIVKEVGLYVKYCVLWEGKFLVFNCFGG